MRPFARIGALLLIAAATCTVQQAQSASGVRVLPRYSFQRGAGFSGRLMRNVSQRIVSNQPGASDTQVEHDRVDISVTVQQVYSDMSALLGFQYAHAITTGHDTQEGNLTVPPNFLPSLRLTTDGRISGASSNDQMIQPLDFPELPRRPVSVGDAWSTTPVPFEDGSSTLPSGAEERGLSVHSIARLLALTGSIATVGEKQSVVFTFHQAKNLFHYTFTLVRTERVSLINAVLISQQSQYTLTGTKNSTVSAVLSESDDVVAIPPPPTPPQLLATLATIPVGPSPQCIAVDPTTHHAFVGNTGSDTVTMLDTRSNRPLRVIRVGLGPQALAVDAARGQVIVVSGGASAQAATSGLPRTPGSVTLLDAATGKVKRVLDVGIYPSRIALDDAHGRAYITDDLERILVVDVARGVVLAPIPMLAGQRPIAQPVLGMQGQRLFVLAQSDQGGGAVVAIDTRTNTQIYEASLQDSNLEQLSYDGATDHLFVTSEQQGEGVQGLGTLTTLDAATGNVVHVERHFGTEPAYMAVAGADRHLFVADYPTDHMLIADTRTGRLIRTLAFRPQPDLVYFDGATDAVLILCDSGNLGVIDARSVAVRGYSAIGPLPFQAVVDHTTGHIFVVSENDATVSVLAGG